ncbi:MAG: TetR family transcriptional regulator [Roseovarius sp.]|nr:TetR family transcriptional regulator [Roseovarius sp.]
MSRAPRSSLTPDDWLAAGLAALAETGPTVLGAEPLARRMGTTKGSFYWHFADVPAYCEALLSRWRTAAEGTAGDMPDAPAPARLRALVETIAAPHPAEAAIRAWAATNACAARCIRDTDARRLDRIRALLASCGIANPDMARILLGAAIGMQTLDDPEASREAIGSLVDLVLALR